MSSIDIDRIDWLQQIDNVDEDLYKGCYKLGGLLSLAKAANLVSGDFLNSCFHGAHACETKVQYLANGYLFWRFSSESRTTWINFHGERTTGNWTISLETLFDSLDNRSIKMLLPSLNNNDRYIKEILGSNSRFFCRLWPLVSECRATGQLRSMSVHLENWFKDWTAAERITKLFVILTDQELVTWVSGDLRKAVLPSYPQTTLSARTSEHAIIKRVVKVLYESDLQRLWSAVESSWSDSRLKGQNSLGQAFLEGLCEREDIETAASLNTLITRVEEVVDPTISTLVDFLEARMRDLRIEFLTNNPFISWGHGRNILSQEVFEDISQ